MYNAKMLKLKDYKKYIDIIRAYEIKENKIFSDRKIAKILNIDIDTLAKIVDWWDVSTSTKEKIVNNFDLYLSTFVSDLK